MGTIYCIAGISQKGKNRVKEHGSLWECVKVEGGEMLLKSTQDGYLKWMELTKDRDFRIAG